jgi:hypothetical protein
VEAHTTSALEESLKSEPEPAENESKELRLRKPKESRRQRLLCIALQALCFHAPLGHPHEGALDTTVLIIDRPNELLRSSGLADSGVRAESSIGLELLDRVRVYQKCSSERT